jgi:predicted tellurium resistance membrane protein TerC
MDALANTDAWIALVSLAAMEIVLGIDNIVFITILVGRLPPEKRPRARRIGLIAALVMRLGLLFALSAIMKLTQPVLTVLEHPLSGRDLILLGGGLFLIFKATLEIHHKLEGGGEADGDGKGKKSRGSMMIIMQIMVIDIVFSLDSVITAVGMAQQLWVMVTAMIIAVGVMLIFAGAIGDFVERHPSIKILALSFLMLIGVMLVGEGLGQHIEKGYVYFAMGFSLFVEMLNIRRTKALKPVHLRSPYEEPPAASGA